MGKVLAVVNQKGGVGKTTTAVNLGAYLAAAGKRVLLVDLDPQANASSGLGLDISKLEAGIYEALIGEQPIFQVIKRSKQDNFLVAPATVSLAGAGIELVSLDNREFRLQEILNSVRLEYDYIIIDGPPSLGLLTINSLVAADEILIPIQSEYYALEGLGQLLQTINLIQENLKPELKIMGAVVTMFDRRNKLSALVLEDLKKNFPGRIFETIIPRSVRLAEAPSFGRSILQYEPRGRGGQAYQDLAAEVISLETK
ncbi:ParA family protein [Candidatus Falkowbacteria bacterium]|jgi:chromosome partitioning protein|nr:AAA family ATPase [Patescibacteria group bacterium]MDD3435211.1 AAA family ATPase [Patescibacteria group bacterium]MDD4466400.1 AAA family ATPase [Patescibacteria group bacterium]NCU42835.1 ParA family protein [Candidatus Falkowbacteria bacterium]